MKLEEAPAPGFGEQAKLAYTEVINMNVRHVLNGLLKEIEPIDFREHLDADQKLQQKHFLVSTVDNLLGLAKSRGWGLARHYDFIYIYNGQYWIRVDKDTFMSFLGEAAHKMGVSYMDSKFYTFRENLLKQFYVSAHLEEPVVEKDRVLINLKNGTFEFSKTFCGLREFRMEDFLKYQLPFEFKEDAEAPKFQKYLNEVLPAEELQNILAEFMGYVFIRDLKLEKCLLLQGTGANGKSVFFEIMNALLGRDNVANYSLANLAEEHNRAQIADKLLNYGSEISSKMSPDMFKQIVSNEPIQCRLKYGQSFIMENYAKLCFNCNELPREVEINEAYFRRFLIVPFRVTIPEGQRDPNLAKSIIADELPGVFNWVLGGLSRLMANKGFSPSPIVDEALDAFKLETDSVYTFINEGRIKNNGQFYYLRAIYASYRHHTQESGGMPVKNVQFSKRLRKYGFKDERKNAGMGFYMEFGEPRLDPNAAVFREPILEVVHEQKDSLELPF